MMEPRSGHKEVFTEPVEGLEDLFTAELLAEYYRKYRRNFEVLEGKLAEFDFDAYRQRNGEFVGRQFVSEVVDDFIQNYDRGYFILTGESGIGKTAFLTHWVDHNESDSLPVRFYYRRGRNLGAFDFVRHCYHQLLLKHNIEDRDPPKDPDDYPRKLDSLLKTISERYLGESQKEIIVIDGLDEAGDAPRRVEVLRAIPREIPRGIYFLLSSRPVPELDALERESPVRRYPLSAEGEANQQDLRLYLERRLRAFIDSGEIDTSLFGKIHTTAEGNFLWAEQLTSALQQGTVKLANLSGVLPRLSGLENLYREFWSRILEGLSPEEERRTWRVAGILAAARSALTAEQICAFSGITADEFIVTRRSLQQYLDAAAIENSSDFQNSLVGYRIYHASFRDYLAQQPDFPIRKYHARITDWYLNLPGGPKSWDRYGISFVPWHLAECGRLDALAALLTDYNFVEAKVQAGMSYDLVRDYQLAGITSQEAVGEVPTAFENGQRFIDSESHILAQYPELFFQQAINQPDESAMAQAAERHRNTGPSADGYFLRWLNKPTQITRSPLIRTFVGHNGTVNAIAVTPNGKQLVSGSDDGTLKLWDLPSGECTATLRGHTDRVSAVAVTPDGKQVVSASEDKTLKVWELKNGDCVTTLRGHRGPVYALALAPDGEQAVSGSRDETLKVWDLRTRECLSTLTGHDSWIHSISLAPDGQRVILATRDNTIRIWDLRSKECLSALSGHTAYVTSVVLTSDGQRAVSASRDGTLKIWDLRTSDCLSTLRGHSGYVNTVALTQDGKRAVSGSRDNSLKVWDLESGECVSTLTGHSGNINTVLMTPDGAQAISGSQDRTLKQWDLRGSECPSTISRHGKEVTTVALTSDGKRAVSGSNENTLKVWDLERWECLSTLSGHTSWVRDVALTSDEKRAISGSWDKTLKVWDVRRAECVLTLTGHRSGVTAVAITPDGYRAISGSHDKTLKVWDVQRAKCTSTLKGHQGAVTSVFITPDGTRAVSGSYDKTLKVWDTESGECILTLKGHRRTVTTVALSPDMQQAISGSKDETLKIWDIRTGECILTLTGHSYRVLSVALFKDGKRAISGSYDRTLKVWDLKNGKCLSTFLALGGVTTCAAAPKSETVCGDNCGQLYILRLERRSLRG